ncbi:hypothetical protein ORJ03_16540 [Rheinheimera baltica]|nr:hypothetical protein [Rheinheimera baltica]
MNTDILVAYIYCQIKASLISALPSVYCAVLNKQNGADKLSAVSGMQSSAYDNKLLCRLLIVDVEICPSVLDVLQKLAFDVVITTLPVQAIPKISDNTAVIVANTDSSLLGPAWLSELELIVSRLIAQRQQQRYTALKQMLAARQSAVGCSAKTFLLSWQSYLLLDGALPVFQAAKHQITADLLSLSAREQQAFVSLQTKMQVS